MIKLENVSLVFQGGSVALSNVTTSVKEGEFIYLIGPSGSGKSSFLKLLYKEYFATKPTPLEVIESCSENRICETFGGFYFVHIKNKIMHAVDVKSDIKKVEKSMLSK